MSAKYIYTISDENPDLKKQIGCMNGIFQLFDRHHFLGRSRRLLGQNHKRLPSGQSGMEIKRELNKSKEKDQKNAIKEKRRVSTESSRTSFSSSSCSSSLSSLECSKTCQVEASSVAKIAVQDSALCQVEISSHSRQPSANIQDFVKDSLYREARGISVKTAPKGTASGHTLMYVDSPRPLQQSKPESPRISGLKESFQILQKLQEVPKKSNEGKQVPLSASFRDSPRFSYDGRESKDSIKSTVKLKPRLSLDSRAGPVRGSDTELKLNSPLGNLRKGHEKFDDQPNQQEEPGSYQQQSSVVAKLMGLESLPDPISFNGYQTGSNIGSEKQSQVPVSPRTHSSEPSSPQQKNANLPKKPAAGSKAHIEPAPWKQPDGSKSSSAPVSNKSATTAKGTNSYPSVYAEIEKRLEQLEFKKSGKDLRALKQILGAMQKKRETLAARNEASDLADETDSNCSQVDSLRSAKQQNLWTVAGLKKESSLLKSFESSIVIKKPTKPIARPANLALSAELIAGLSGLHRLRTGDSAESKKESVDKQAANDLTPRTKGKSSPSNHPQNLLNRSAVTQSKRSAQNSPTRESKSTVKTSTNMKSRQQPKKIGFEKQYRPTAPTSDSRRTIRQQSQQVMESHSQNRRPRPKSSNMHRPDDELRDISGDTRAYSNQTDLISSTSETNMSLASQIDDEVSSTNNYYRIYSKAKQTNETNKHEAQSMKETPPSKAAVTSTEQPSPVSVLDATFYGDELPSPVKKISIAFQGEETLDSDNEFNHSSRSTNSSINTTVNNENAAKIEPLIQNLKHLGSLENSTTYDGLNSNHRYIAEILFASGLLKDSESSSITTPLNLSGVLVNSDPFFILEQAKASTTQSEHGRSGKGASQLQYHAKVQQKLLFDVVIEVLENNLLSQGPSTPWLSSNTLAGERSKGYHLLEKLFSEVDRLQGFTNNLDEEDILENILCEDLTKQSTQWMVFHHTELPKMVLDIERLIFKDLITEIVTGDAIKSRGAPGHCRQLF